MASSRSCARATRAAPVAPTALSHAPTLQELRLALSRPECACQAPSPAARRECLPELAADEHQVTTASGDDPRAIHASAAA